MHVYDVYAMHVYDVYTMHVYDVCDVTETNMAARQAIRNMKIRDVQVAPFNMI